MSAFATDNSELLSKCSQRAFGTAFVPANELGRRVAAIGLVLLLHFFLIRLLILNGTIAAKHERQGFVNVSIVDAPSATHALEEPRLQLDKPTDTLAAPKFEIESSGEEGDAGSENSIIGTVLPPRPDPQSPNVAPNLPPELRDAASAGRSVVVVVRALVLESGAVGDVAIAGSCGVRGIDALALDQVKRYWRFLPATAHGSALSAWITVEVLFKAG